jgi:hypothetical protein
LQADVMGATGNRMHVVADDDAPGGQHAVDQQPVAQAWRHRAKARQRNNGRRALPAAALRTRLGSFQLHGVEIQPVLLEPAYRHRPR